MPRTTATVAVVTLTLAACGSAEGDDGESLQDFLGMGDETEARQAQFHQQQQRELEEHLRMVDGTLHEAAKMPRPQLRRRAVLDAWVPLTAPAIGGLVGLIAGAYPTLRAARLEPLEALRS